MLLLATAVTVDYWLLLLTTLVLLSRARLRHALGSDATLRLVAWTVKSSTFRVGDYVRVQYDEREGATVDRLSLESTFSL